MASIRRSVMGISVAVLLGLAAPVLSMGAMVGAQDDGDPPHPVHIHTGTCADLGEIVAPLNDVAPPTGGESGGATLASPVELSETEVELGLADILAAPHAINAHESAENIGEYVACGEVGGRVVDGVLLIGLRETNGSDLSGVAVLEADDDDETDVTVYLVEEGAVAGAEEAPAAGAAPTAATAAPTAAPPAAPTAAPAETAEPVETAAPAGEEVAVDIRDFAYEPAEITVAVGDTITWTNQDPVPHTATATERGVLQSGAIAPDGGSFSQTFEATGTYDYFCEFHPNMEGTIVVE